MAQVTASTQFTHRQYAFSRWEAYWCLTSAWMQSDLYREMASLIQEGIPEEAMHLVNFEFDRSGGRRYYRIAIDLSADVQLAALAERQHHAWLAQKAQDAERYARAREEALRNQEAQGMNDPDFVWEV